MKQFLHTKKSDKISINLWDRFLNVKKLLLFLSFILTYGFSFGQIDGLSISKKGIANGDPGQLVTYTITFNNEADKIATDAVVVDTLPSADLFTFVSASDGGIWNPSARTVTWTKNEVSELGFLTVIEKSVSITGRLGRTGYPAGQYDPSAYYMPSTDTTLTNSVTISNTGFNSATANFTTSVKEICQPDIADELEGVVKSSGGSYTIFQYVVYNSGNINDRFTINVSEGTGPGQSKGTVLRQILDEYQVAQTSTEANPTWTTPYIAAGATYIFYVKIYIDQSPANTWDYTNIILNSNFDSNCKDAGTVSTFILNPKGPAFSFNKIDSPDPVNAGDTITYRLYIANAGDIASNTVLTENYNSQVEFISANPAPTSGNNVWDLGTVGSTPILVEVTVRVKTDIANGALIPNEAVLTYLSGSETANAVTTVKSSANLEITKVADVSTAFPGEEIIYTLKVKNIGNYTASGISITDNYDENFISVISSDATINSGTELRWPSLGSLAPNDSITKTYTAKINDSSNFTSLVTQVNNTASVTISGIDSDLTNNTASETVLVTLLPDLKITKDGPNPASFDSDFIYTLTITNTGLTDATTVKVEDTLPPSVTYVSSSDGGTESGGIITWNIGSLAKGDTITRTVTVNAPCSAITELTNTARVFTTNGSNEPDFSNNQTTFTHTIEDNIDPTAICKNVTIQLNANGVASVTANQVDNGSYDNCGIASISVYPSSFTCENIGDNSVILTVTDFNGNSSTCSATVTVEDNIYPTASNPEPINIQCIDDIPAPDISVVTDENDNCSTVVTFVSDSSDSKSCPETITRTYNVADDSGNSIDVYQTITVNDNTAPVISTSATSQDFGCNPNIIAPVFTGTDNCEGTITPIVTTSGPTNLGSQYSQTWNANYTDACGNSAEQVSITYTWSVANSASIDTTICGELVLNNETFTSSGTYIQLLKNNAGCDSTLTINVNILEPTAETISVEGCEEVTVNDSVYTVTGTYTQLLKNDAGCDSTLTIVATIGITPSKPVVEIIEVPNCDLPTATILVTEPIGPEYQYQIDNGSFQDTTIFTGVSVGEHFITVRDASTNQCISEATRIDVVDLNDSPILTPYEPILTSTDEDHISNTFTINSIVNASITDLDCDALGIAVYATSGRGLWQYYNGINWVNFGAVSENSALLLKGEDQIRYIPDYKNGETVTFSYYAWDQTTLETSGQKTNVTIRGNGTAFSNENDIATLEVTPVNDAPELDAELINLGQVNLCEPIAFAKLSDFYQYFGGNVTISDVDYNSLKGIAIHETTGNGNWEYSYDGITWFEVSNISINSALLLDFETNIRITTQDNCNDTTTFSFFAWDQTEGESGEKVDVTTRGGVTAFSLEGAKVSIVSIDTISPIIETNEISQDLGCDPIVTEPIFSGIDNCEGTITPIVTTSGPTNLGSEYSQTWYANYTDACGNAAEEVIITYTWSTSTSETIEVAGCDSVVVNEVAYYTSGTYTQDLINAENCDSTLTIIATVTNSSQETIEVAGCDSVVVNGTAYYTSGTYTQDLINAENCDSTLTIFATVTNSSQETIEVAGCDSVVVNGTAYYTSGTYTQDLINAENCDSTLTIIATVTNSSQETIERTVCDQLTINGETFTESGVYTQNLVNTAGCDSTLTINLTVNESSEQVIRRTACDFYELNDQIYSESGTYIQNLTTQAGCDLTITLILTINESSEETIEVSGCDSVVVNEVVYYNSGTYIQELTNAAGCDSTLTIIATVNESSEETIEVTECNVVVINDIEYTVSGTYTQVLTNVDGCDSTLTIIATILESSEETIEVSGCDMVVVNDVEYTNSGTYTQNLTNAEGCDSILTVIATVLESTEETMNVTVCSELTINGETYTETGTYTQQLTNAAGCDSTLIINLAVGDNSAPVVFCKDTVAQLNENGIFTLTTEDIDNGSYDNCSIDTMFLNKYEFTCADLGENEVTLTVIDAYGNKDSCTATVVIEAGSYDCGNGQLITEDDILTVAYCRGDEAFAQINLFTNDGEFTLDQITMTVSELPENVEVNLADGTMTYSTNNPVDGTFTFTYTVCHNVNTENCSTAEVTINVIVDSDCDGIPDDIDIDDDGDGILDIDEGDGLIDSDGDGIPDILDIDSDNDGITDNEEWQEEGNYIAPSGIDANNNGWDDAYDVEMDGTYYAATDTNDNGTPDYLDSDSDNDGINDIIEGNDANLDQIADFMPTGLDSDGDGLDDAYDTFNLLSNSSDKHLNSVSSNVPLQDRDNNGLRDWRDIYIESPDPQVQTEDLFIPNGFSPNGDGINDYFVITYFVTFDDGSYSDNLEGFTFEDKYPNAKVEIYNRWEQLVYKKDNYGNTSVSGIDEAWWDGRSNAGMTIGNDKLPPATYYYILYFNDGKTEPKAGFIFLNR